MWIILKGILQNWQAIAIAIILGTLFYIIFAWWGANAEITRLKAQINLCSDKNEALLQQISTFESAENLAKEKLKQASEERKEIITSLSKEINKIRVQNIPRDCNAAVAYGIKFKDDLQWPGQQ